MKRLLTLCLISSLVLTVNAKPLTRQQAREKAEALLGKSTSAVARQGRQLHGIASPQPAYYVFNAADGRGFAMVSADDELGDVLGYSMEHAFPLEEEMPCALSLYLEAFTKHVEACGGQQAQTAAETTFNADAPKQLCTTEWGQGAPYNALCPVVGGRACPSGCVATAIAQIMYYWKWPAQGKGYGVATDNDGITYSASLEHAYNWDVMLPTTVQLLASQEAADAVSVLMYDCGLALNMKYSPDGSATGLPSKALYTNFNYRPTPLRVYFRECFTDSEWLNIIRREIDHGRPIFHSASSKTYGGNDSSGHAFVVDGYDQVGNVSVNWGWDGQFNGYYAIDRMNPGGYEYTVDQEIVVGIEPNKDGEEGLPEEYLLIKEAPQCSKTGTISTAASFDITVGNFNNPNSRAHQWQLSVGIFDESNNMLGEVKNGRVSSIKLEPNYYNAGTLAIPCLLKETYDNGNYALRVVFRESGAKQWLLPDMVGGLAKNAVYISINGNKVTFTDGTEYIAAAINAPTATAAADATTHVYDASGRMLYSAPTRLFNINSVPAHGILVVKQGRNISKVVR